MSLEREESRAHALIDQWFVSDLTPRQWRQLRATLEHSASTRAHYDSVAAARSAVRPLEIISTDRLGAIEDALFVKPQRSRPGVALWWLAPVAAMVIAFVMLRKPVDDFTPRASSSALTSIRAFCIAGNVRSVASDDGGAACSVTDTLQLSYAMAEASPHRYVFLVGVDASRAVMWYFPTPDEGQSLAVASTHGAERVLPDSIALAVNHQPGPLKIYGIFTRTPLTIDVVKLWLATNKAIPAPSDLGVDDAVVHVLDVELSAR